MSEPDRPNGPPGEARGALTTSQLARWAVFAGLLWAGMYYAVANYFGPGSHAAPPQADSLIFQQYARAWSEGRPYRFIPGDDPSTGSTSHLYPAALGALHRLGARGDALATAGFALNAVFYLLFLLFFTMAAARLSPRAAPLALGLAALHGQAAYQFFSQTDMGMFVTLTFAAFAAALARRWALTALALALAGLCRPEGLILSFLLLAAAALPTDDDGQPRAGMAAAAIMGLAGGVASLTINAALTGEAGFMSMRGRGVFQLYPWPGALYRTVGALNVMAREIFAGMGSNGRAFYLLPAAGAVLSLVGLASRSWQSGRTVLCEIWMVASGLGVVLLVAGSNLQGLQYDRYLTWILPLWLFYAAEGAVAVSRTFNSSRSVLALATVLMGYQAAGNAFFLYAFAHETAYTAQMARFTGAVAAKLPEDTRIGLPGLSGLAYYAEDRPATNIFGIVSPEFASGRIRPWNFEMLKRRPELRPDVWLFVGNTGFDDQLAPFLGPPLAIDPPAYGDRRGLRLHAADWSRFEAAETLNSPSALDAIAGQKMVSRLDVGLVEDEERARRRTFSRMTGAQIQPFIHVGLSGKSEIVEIGRVIIGSESFTVPTHPGRPLTIVLRTSRMARAEAYDYGAHENVEQEFQIPSPMTLDAQIDFISAANFTFDFQQAPGDFEEFAFVIPGERIVGDRTRLTIVGDHISYGYWFYQPAQ